MRNPVGITEHIDDSWCTITEFRRISSWRQFSKRRLQQILKEDCFKYPVKKLYCSSRKFIYMIQLTDPTQLKALRTLREKHYVRKRVKEQTRKVFGDVVKCNTKAAMKEWTTVRLNIKGYDCVFIQSSEFLGSLYDYIRSTGEDVPIKKEKSGDIFVHVPKDIYAKLSKIAKKVPCSIGGALRILTLEFLKTPQGKAAAMATAFFTTKLSHPKLDRDKYK